MADNSASDSPEKKPHRAHPPRLAGVAGPLRAAALEPRFMFDAAAVATGAEVLAAQVASRQAAGSVVVAGSQGVSGGGAAFANGAMYLGVENVTGTNNLDRIYKLNFASDGRSITSTSVLVASVSVSGGADWGDLAVDTTNNVLISTAANDSNGRSFIRYDLGTGAQLSNVTYASSSVQLSTGGNGALYALGGTTLQNLNPATGAVISTVNVTTNGSTAITGSVTDGAGAVPGTGTIGDRIFDDNNGDGVFGVGDTGIANVTVQLIDDVNGNGVADTGERVLATDTTSATGNYLFTGVLPGAYVVRVTDGSAR